MEEFSVLPTSTKGSLSAFVNDDKRTREKGQVSQLPLLYSSNRAAMFWLREKAECRSRMQNSCMAVKEDISQTEQRLIPVTAAL